MKKDTNSRRGADASRPYAVRGEDLLQLLTCGGNVADLVPDPLPPEFQEWRVFHNGRSLTTVIVASADDAIALAAALYSVPRQSLTALEDVSFVSTNAAWREHSSAG